MAQDPPADAPSDPQRRARSISIGARKSRPYKVVFEPVVQQQKKLRTDVSFSARPPPDYTFVAAGTPDLTEKCKEYSRQGNHLVYIVSDTKTPSIRLSRHIHRIGHHFLSSIVERACQFLNIALDKWMGTLASASAPAAAQAPTPAVVPKPVATPDPATVTRYLRSRAITRSIDDDRPMTPPPPHVRPSTKASPSRAPESQEMLNDKARDALTDLFPKMPAEDRDLIIARAFDKARKKVGTVNSLPISRRVHLAALAHIRHVYSDYDKLLHTDGWTEARSRVRKICENKLLTWRGDEENGRDVFEEIFREVIYISSDGDDEEFEDAAAEPPGDKAGHATSTTRRPTSTSPGEVQEITSRKRKASPDQVRSYHAPAQRHEETDRQPTEVNLESNIRNQIVQRRPSRRRRRPRLGC
ncbi:MAG: hypothetical protein M1838_000723 [Thelocarpon superellum]|nr:MAG: hypothetical protein M1838_000723 [Thelocarpon superellum]